MSWSNVQVGHFVRWSTPRFVKYGVVLNVKGNSMVIQFNGDDRATVIPDARWYYAIGKLDPNAEEHLVVLQAKPARLSPIIHKVKQGHTAWITVQAASEMINMDPKQLRRYIRRGTIPATKDEDRWKIDGEALKALAAKNGWI